MEEEKNTAAAVDWEEAPNLKHRKRSRKRNRPPMPQARRDGCPCG